MLLKMLIFPIQRKKHGSIQNITINIASGECVLLCGKSGCGKTTITKLINGLIPHFNNGELSGETVVDDMKVADTPLYKLSQKVGSVFQNPKSQFLILIRTANWRLVWKIMG